LARKSRHERAFWETVAEGFLLKYWDSPSKAKKSSTLPRKMLLSAGRRVAVAFLGLPHVRRQDGCPQGLQKMVGARGFEPPTL
jgi:hypothetical protein